MSEKPETYTAEDSEPLDTREIALSGDLNGYTVTIDNDALTFGFLEDIQSENAGRVLDALEEVIVGGNLPYGIDRDGLRRLKPAEIVAVLAGVSTAFAVPKSAPQGNREVRRRNARQAGRR